MPWRVKTQWSEVACILKNWRGCRKIHNADAKGGQLVYKYSGIEWAGSLMRTKKT